MRTDTGPDTVAPADPRLERVVAGLAGGVLLEDEQRRIVVINQSFCDLFAIPVAPEGLVGADCAGAAAAAAPLFEDGDGFIARIDEILAAQTAVSGELLVMTGGRRVERDYVPIWIDDVYRGHLWHYRDVSAREYALKRVRRDERRFRALVQSSPVAIYELDAVGRATFVSESGWAILGDPRGPDIATRWLSAIHPDDLPAVQDAWTRAAAAGTTFSHEYRVERPDGEHGHVVSSAVPVPGDDGRPCGFVGTLHDITDIRRLERVKDEFIAAASHELRTPLAAARMFTELLQQDGLTPDQTAHVEVIDRNIKRLVRLVDDLLFLAREDLDRIRLAPSDIDLAALAEQAVQSAAPAASGGHVRLRRTGADRLDIRGDADRLGQVLDNLLSNAVKFSPLDGEVVVDVRPAPGRAILEVRDEGPGVPDADLERLFERFFQSGDARRHAGGTGLGLSVVRAIAEAHDGCAYAWRPAGGGLAVTVELGREALDG